MVNSNSQKDKWEIIGYVKISESRYKTLKTINTQYLMPKEIAEQSGLEPSQISKSLTDLKKQNLVFCKNENLRKGRIYKTTELGLEILNMIEKMNK